MAYTKYMYFFLGSLITALVACWFFKRRGEGVFWQKSGLVSNQRDTPDGARLEKDALLNFYGEANGVPDDVFHPPPATSERVQSTQWEHLETEDPNTDLDYKPLHHWPLVRASDTSRRAQINAIHGQIEQAKVVIQHNYNLSEFLQDNRSNIEFDAMFNDAHKRHSRIISNWPVSENRAVVLASYQMRLSDDLAKETQKFVDQRQQKFSRDVDHHAESQFSEKPTFHRVGDRLVPGSRKTDPTGGITQLSCHQIRKIAQEHVAETYTALLDQYKFLIDDMDVITFKAESSAIMSIGNEMVTDYIRAETPDADSLDAFITHVREAMEESLFDILIRYDVDVEQYGDPAPK